MGHDVKLNGTSWIISRCYIALDDIHKPRIWRLHIHLGLKGGL